MPNVIGVHILILALEELWPHIYIASFQW